MVTGDGALCIDRAGTCSLLAGDIDEATHAGLVAALDSAADVHADIHVDLAGVEFCGLAGLRAFVLPSRARHLGPDHHGGSSCTSLPVTTPIQPSCGSSAGTPLPA